MLFDGMTIKARVDLCDLIDTMPDPTPRTIELRARLTAEVLAELPNLETTSET